jgi:tRNA threonylcarbamoyladenosine biosynthesis protein TsaE
MSGAAVARPGRVDLPRGFHYADLMSQDGPERVHTTNPEETLAIGERLGARIADRSRDGAVVLLEGPLGAGKTVIAKGVARALGVREQVISPTYTIISEYSAGATRLYHVDLYRIEGREQMENLGLEDILAGPGIVLVEWGEKLPRGAAGAHTLVTISIAADGGRDILVEDRAS